MKICFATNYLPGYHQISAGAEFATYRILKLLLREKYQINVLSTIPAKHLQEDFELFPIKVTENFLGSKLGHAYQIMKLIGFSFDPVLFIQSYKILKKLKPDILHLHHFNILSLSIIKSAKILRIPIIVSIYDYWLFCPNSILVDNDNICEKFQGRHCIECLKFGKAKFLKNIILYFRKYFFDTFLKNIDSYIVLSSSSSNILQKYGIKKERIHIAHQPFSFDNIKENKFTDIEKFSILYAGWLQHRKGLHIILEAMPYILKEIPEAKLYIYGLVADKEYEKKIYNLIDKFNLNRSIIMQGKKEPPEFYDMLGRANIIVIPEQWENMSPVILVEAMVYGKPIVASRIGGIPEFITDGENGYLAHPKNPLDFAKKIIKILKDENTAETFGENARCSAEKFFDENTVLKNLTEVYKIYER